MSETDKSLIAKSDEKESQGLGVAVFYKKKLRQKLRINYTDMFDVKEPQESASRKRPRNLLDSKKDTKKKETECDDDENFDIQTCKKDPKRQKGVSEYEQKVLRNIAEKNELLRQLNFLGQKEMEKKPRRKYVKRIAEPTAPSSRVMRTLQPKNYEDQVTED